MNKLPMQVALQTWANEHEPSEEMLYKKGYWTQILFVRDKIPYIFAKSQSEYDAVREHTDVISTHVSKSITLPVFQVNLEKIGVVLRMRYNFYDWKISVASKKPLAIDFDNLIVPTENINPIFCEGFQTDWVYPAYKHNQQTFTVEILDEYKLYTFLWLIQQQLS